MYTAIIYGIKPLHFAYLLSNYDFLFSIILLGDKNPKYDIHSLITPVFIDFRLNFIAVCIVLALISRSWWLGGRVVSVLDSGGEGPGSNRSCDAVG